MKYGAGVNAEGEGATPLDLTVQDAGGVVTVRFSGDLDMDTAGLLVDAFERIFAAGSPQVVLDFADLDFLDSTGVRVLLTAHLHATKKGMRFGVARAENGMVRKLIEVTRIDQRFPVVDDPAELAEGEAPSSAAQ